MNIENQRSSVGVVRCMTMMKQDNLLPKVGDRVVAHMMILDTS